MNPFFSEAAARFAGSTALVDRRSGLSVGFGGLVDFLESRPLPDVGFVASRSESFFDHAVFLLGMLARGAVVAPVGHRLPLGRSRELAAGIGVSGFWNGGAFEPMDGSAPPVEGPGTVLFTSGSSGVPKAVAHRFHRHVASARGAAERIPLGPGDGWLVSLPPHHVSGFSIPVRCLLAGATAVFPDQGLDFCSQVRDSAVTHLSVVDTQLRRLLRAGVDLSGLKAVLVGGGPVPRDLVSQALDAGVPLHVTYGMTEAASQVCTTQRLFEVPERIHAGTPLPGREVRTVGGRIEVRGEVVADSVSASDGWMQTGDCGRFDSEGNLVVEGRVDRMIVSGGENIHPEAVEILLAEAPGVGRAVVVGVPSEEFGMRPVAFVAGDFSGEGLRDFLRGRVEAFAVPDRFLKWPSSVDSDAAKPDYRALEKLALGR